MADKRGFWPRRGVVGCAHAKCDVSFYCHDEKLEFTFQEPDDKMYDSSLSLAEMNLWEPREVSGIEYFFAIAVRVAFLQSSFRTHVHDRVEVSTPLNSLKRLLEGIHLYNQDVDPYAGDLFHESPLTLIVFKFLIQYLGQWVEVLFIATDILAAHLLYKTAYLYVSYLENKEAHNFEIGKYIKESANLVVTRLDAINIPAYVAYAYLFNPYIILNCVGLTTTCFANLMLAGVLYSMVNQQKFICVILLALVSLQSLYPVTLIVPVCFQFYNTERSKKCVFQVLFLFSTAFTCFLGLSYWISGSWKFLDSTFGFILTVNDLTPNIGLFWYFFTEMFEHFRALFISALQINATVLYLFPLTMHLKKDPVFLLFVLTALTAVFKSYPSLGDVGFYLSLLPMWKHLYFFMQQSFIIICILIITSILGPTVWHLWIYAGSANANFFFGVTLAFATAQIFLVTDLLFAHKKRAFALKKGLPDESSENALVLD